MKWKNNSFFLLSFVRRSGKNQTAKKGKTDTATISKQKARKKTVQDLNNFVVNSTTFDDNYFAVVEEHYEVLTKVGEGFFKKSHLHEFQPLLLYFS